MKSRSERNSTQFFKLFFSHSACKVHASTLVFVVSFSLFWFTVLLLIYVCYALSSDYFISFHIQTHFFLVTFYFRWLSFQFNSLAQFLLCTDMDVWHACIYLVIYIFAYMYICTYLHAHMFVPKMCCEIGFQFIFETNNCFWGGNYV